MTSMLSSPVTVLPSPPRIYFPNQFPNTLIIKTSTHNNYSRKSLTEEENTTPSLSSSSEILLHKNFERSNKFLLPIFIPNPTSMAPLLHSQSITNSIVSRIRSQSKRTWILASSSCSGAGSGEPK